MHMCSGTNCEPGGCPVADGAVSSGSDGSGIAVISANMLKEKKIKVEGATNSPVEGAPCSPPEPSPSPSLLPRGEADTPPSPPLEAVTSPKALRLGMRANEVELYPERHPEGGYPSHGMFAVGLLFWDFSSDGFQDGDKRFFFPIFSPNLTAKSAEITYLRFWGNLGALCC